MSSRQRREANLGIVLISVSVLFILCQSVKLIPDIYEVVTCRLGSNQANDTSKWSAAFAGSNWTAADEGRGAKGGAKCQSNYYIDMIIDISHLLLAINSSANFIIYTWRGEAN